MPPKRAVASPARNVEREQREQQQQQREQQQQQQAAIAPDDRAARGEQLPQPVVAAVQRPAYPSEPPHGGPDESIEVASPVASEDGGTCAVCLTAPADFLCSPCGHQCGCEACLRQVQASGGSKCPICRVRFSAIQRVYRAGSDAIPDAAPTLPPAAGSSDTAPPLPPAGSSGGRDGGRDGAAAMRQNQQLGDMADAGIGSAEDPAWSERGPELQQPLMGGSGRGRSTAEPKRNRACCCGALLILMWGATFGLIYGTDQPCGTARGWHGPAAVPTLGCNETWGGSCNNHTYVDFVLDPNFFGCPLTHCRYAKQR